MSVKYIILALVLSADAFSIGIAFGTEGITICAKSKIILSCVSFFIAIFSLISGELIFSLIPSKAIHSLSALMLIIPGALIIKQALMPNTDEAHCIFKTLCRAKNILKTPVQCDLDLSKTIDTKEAFLLGMALSLDSICATASAAARHENMIFLPFLIVAFQLLLLLSGINTGIKIRHIYTENQDKWIFISGILLVMMGFSNLF